MAKNPEVYKLTVKINQYDQNINDLVRYIICATDSITEVSKLQKVNEFLNNIEAQLIDFYNKL